MELVPQPTQQIQLSARRVTVARGHLEISELFHELKQKLINV